MGHGTLGVRPFRLLHPGPHRHAATAPEWTVQDRDLVAGPGVFLVTMVTPRGRVRGVALACEVGPDLPASGMVPHEDVDERAVTRRVRAGIRARVDREPVLLTHSGGGLAISAAARAPVPLYTVARGDRIIEVSQVADDDRDIVLADLARRWCLVADGHHRLAAWSRRAAEAGAPGQDAVAPAGTGVGRELVSALVVDGDDTPLHVDPIHRILTRRGSLPLRASDVAAAVQRVLARAVRTAAVPGGRPSSVREITGHRTVRVGDVVRVLDRRTTLDVQCSPVPGAGLFTAAHIVEAAMQLLAPHHVRRTPDAIEVVTASQRRGTVSLVMPEIPPTDIFDTVAVRALMPVKATSFHPKLPAGVIVRALAA